MPGATEGAKTQRSYDTVAAKYAARYVNELSYKPLDRALLSLLVEEVGAAAPIADLGCGPGHVAGWMAARGARVVGIDISEEMVATGAKLWPQAEFRQGDLLDLPAGDGEFGAAVAFYTILHLLPAELPAAFAEMERVLRPGAALLVAFHVGSDSVHLDEWWDQPVDLDFRQLEVQSVADGLEGAGLKVVARVERAPYAEEVETNRAYLLARRPL